MYWSTFNPGSIFKAEMDGSHAVEIISGPIDLAGIAIDFDSLRLFWVDAGASPQNRNRHIAVLLTCCSNVSWSHRRRQYRRGDVKMSARSSSEDGFP